MFRSAPLWQPRSSYWRLREAALEWNFPLVFPLAAINGPHRTMSSPESWPVRLIAIHNFAPQEEHDLGLVKGNLYLGIRLRDKLKWWYGQDPATGNQGDFPANCVARIMKL